MRKEALNDKGIKRESFYIFFFFSHNFFFLSSSKVHEMTRERSEIQFTSNSIIETLKIIQTTEFQIYNCEIRCYSRNRSVKQDQTHQIVIWYLKSDLVLSLGHVHRLCGSIKQV